MQDRAQLEDLEQILHLIDLRYPLNRLGGWAASADFIKIVYKEILALLQNKPNPVILEAGSGVSTILIAYLLEKYAPEATFISLDHDIDYKSKTERELALHNLTNVHLLYAPLRKYQLGQELWYWYETASLIKILQEQTIDLLSIDGPPMATQPLARYPVLPLLQERLAQEYVLLLDDANREDEKAIVDRWKREFGPFEVEHIATEKGTALLRHKELALQPKISICIPTFNRKEYLLQALESALTQRYENFEVVVVDDGSADGTQEMMRNLEDEHVRYFRNEKNRGRPFTRNRCIEEARGEYILWLDDDDTLVADILDQYLLLLNCYKEADVIYGNLRNLDTGELFFTPKDFYQNSRTLMNNLLTVGCPLPNPATMVKKELYEKFGKYDEEFMRAQDYEFWTRIALHTTCKKYDGIGCNYRIHEDNISAGSVELLDSSYESKIIRKKLDEEVIAQAFDYAKSEGIVFYEIAEHMRNIWDNYNALYYYDLSQKGRDKAAIVALQADMISYAKRALQETGEKREVLKQLLKQYSLIKKRSLQLVESQKFNSLDTYIETLQKILPNSWLRFYLLALKAAYQGESKKAQKLAKKSLICSPFSDRSESLLQDLGIQTKEIERIRSWLLDPLNEYEANKIAFIESLK